MIRINQIKIPVTDGDRALTNKISVILRNNQFNLEKIVRKSIDARDKSNLMYIYSVDVSCKNEKMILNSIHNKNVMVTPSVKYSFPYSTDTPHSRPVITGAGPAGYFCGLMLARAGYAPIIIEQGSCVEKRTTDVHNFWEKGIVNPRSNVSFGEGGAGTFSDGKLNTGIKDKSGRIREVIDDFIKFGAPEEIGYINKPHVGTDKLKEVMHNMRNEIIKSGGDIYFDTKLISYRKYNEKIQSITVEADGIRRDIECDVLVLAIGHSARDTFIMLDESGILMEPKALAMGVRIEHRREVIDSGQYGDSPAARLLPAADYKMTYRSKSGRSVYSFCMCPGGYVVNASTNDGQSVVNGMSYHARDGINSNSAIVVGVTPSDYSKAGYEGALAGMYFQQDYEKRAYIEGKGSIPVQLFKDYEENKASTRLGTVTPCIMGKYKTANLNNCLPSYVNNAIIEAVHEYDKKLNGFADGDVCLSGIESRTSSPVRILRNDELMSTVKGIFPCGEGAGYAGGITSAAVDGIRVAEAAASYLDRLNS